MSQSVDKFYVNKIDKELAKFDQAHKPSPAQEAEIAKHNAVYKKRDTSQAQTATADSDLWEGF